jgi:hypothetical protein
MYLLHITSSFLNAINELRAGRMTFDSRYSKDSFLFSCCEHRSGSSHASYPRRIMLSPLPPSVEIKRQGCEPDCYSPISAENENVCQYLHTPIPVLDVLNCCTITLHFNKTHYYSHHTRSVRHAPTSALTSDEHPTCFTFLSHLSHVKPSPCNPVT